MDKERDLSWERSICQKKHTSTSTWPKLLLWISIIVLKAGIDIFKDTVDPLLGMAPDKELINEIEEYTEFNAWWYCCFPMDVVSEENLPLPIFIRGDDLWIRPAQHEASDLMNGICVWHEPFENKYSSFLEYYIIRNRLVDNTFHFPDWGKAQLRRQSGDSGAESVSSTAIRM